MNIEAKNIAGKTTPLKEVEIHGLEGAIRGRVITPSSPEYDEARKIWNAMIDKRPAFIVQCTGTADVSAAVEFAKRHALLISVRGAGHNIAGRALEDGVMLIDLSLMRHVHVDPNTKRAFVSPGATLRDLDHETQAYNLALPVGINSTTGVAGLTLGGGFGWLSRQHGFTIDNLISAEVITVDGARLQCSATQNEDLFWAIRGGGGNFGIVTQFEFQLHPVGPTVMCGPIVFPIDQAKSVLRKYRDLAKTLPRNFTAWAVLRGAPPFPFLKADVHGKPVLILASAFIGPLDEGKKYIDSLVQLGTPLANATGANPFAGFQQAFDPLLTPGMRNYWKTHNFLELSDKLLDLLVDSSQNLPSPHTEIFIAQVGGASNDVATDATAYPHRNAEFVMNVHARWETAGEDKDCREWARRFYKDTLPFATGGSYVNFVSDGDDSLESAYGPNASRLAKIKTKYDPRNVLRTNLNIAPSS